MANQPKPSISSYKVINPWYGSQAENKTNGSFTNEFQSKEPIVAISMHEKNEKTQTEEEDDGHGSIDHPTSYGETLTHLLRGNIGSGMFAMGDAFKNAGIVLAPIIVVVLGFICVHCQHLLLTAAKEMKTRNGMDKYPGFAQTVELCFSTGHPRLKKLAGTMKILVTLFLCITQLGFCCVYFVFISKNLQQVLKQYDIDLDIHYHMAIILLPILVTCLVKNLKYLAPLSTFANLVMLTGIIITLYFVTQDLPSVTERTYVAEIAQLPLFFGTALFAFEGIGLVLPLQKEMKEPKHFAKPLGVLNVGMAFVVALFTTLGFLSYLKYGEDIQGSITLSLDPENILSQVVKIIISLGVLCTFALQFYIPVVILWPKVVNMFGPFQSPVCMELLFRTALVLLTFTLAEVIPYLNHFISLVGAISSTALALLFPPILELATKWSISEVTWPILLKNTLIILLGLLGCVTGTYESIVAIIKAFNDPNQS